MQLGVVREAMALAEAVAQVLVEMEVPVLRVGRQEQRILVVEEVGLVVQALLVELVDQERFWYVIQRLPPLRSQILLSKQLLYPSIYLLSLIQQVRECLVSIMTLVRGLSYIYLLLVVGTYTSTLQLADVLEFGSAVAPLDHYHKRHQQLQLVIINFFWQRRPQEATQKQVQS
jgi:hypothetical protein